MAFPITNQADLYYRNQTPNPGANSGNRVYPGQDQFAAQPYVIRQIGQTWDLGISNAFGLTGGDGLVRGGIPTLTNRTLFDVTRITKFLADSKGPIFITKNAGLQLMNPRMWLSPVAIPVPSPPSFNQSISGFTPSELQNRVGNAGGVSTLRPQLTNTQIFNPASILANVTSSPFGIHLQRHGIPFISENYGNIVKRNNGGIENLKGISNETFFSQSDLEVVVEQRGAPLNDSTKSRLVNLYVNHILYDYTKNTHLIEYPTGPDSMLGIGSTVVKRYENTRLSVKNYIENYSDKTIYIGSFIKNKTPISYKIKTDLGLEITDEELRKEGIIATRITSQQSIFDVREGVAAFTYDQIKENPRIGPGKTKTVKDFRKTLKKGTPSIDILYDNYDAPEPGETASGSFNIHDRVGVADLGNHSTPTTYNGFTGAYDKIGTTDIHSGPYNNGLEGNPLGNDGKATGEKFTRDLVKFSFESINNDNPAKTDVMVFRAYISSFKDDFDAKWNSVKYIGRGEDFYTYEGFNRKISVDFNIFAHSRQEMKPLYRKLLYLFSQTAPDLSAGGKMRAPLMRLTIGNWFYRLPGFITSIGTSVDGKETPWEIALNQPEGGTDVGMLELPKYLSINLSYTPIHNFTPKRGTPSQLTPFLFLKSQDGKTSWL